LKLIAYFHIIYCFIRHEVRTQNEQYKRLLFLCSVVFFLVSITIFCSFVSYCSCQVSYNRSLTVELTCAIKLLLLLVAFSGEKDHYFVDMADDVVRGSIVSHEVVSYVRMLWLCECVCNFYRMMLC